MQNKKELNKDELEMLFNELNEKNKEYELKIKGLNEEIIKEKKENQKLIKNKEELLNELDILNIKINNNKDLNDIKIKKIENEYNYTNNVLNLNSNEYNNKLNKEIQKQNKIINEINYLNNEIEKYKNLINNLDSNNENINNKQIIKESYEMEKFISELK
jgi:hypothetical protein